MTKCDFCSEPDPKYRIRCRSFDVIDPVPVSQPMKSIGDFLACAVCYELVLRDDREGLIRRARTAFIARHRVWSKDAEAELLQFQKQFWENRL